MNVFINWITSIARKESKKIGLIKKRQTKGAFGTPRILKGKYFLKECK